MDAIFFDLDGTLSDPFEGLARSLRFAFEQLGLGAVGDDELRAMIGPPIQVSMRERFEDPALADEVVRLFRVRFADVGLFETTVYPGIPELLERLSGGPQLFVCTSKPFVYAVRVLQRLGFGETFAAVYGSELDGTRADKRELLAYALAEQSGLARDATEELAGADHRFDFPHEVADIIAR
jgi:phosphoglycolate phosphatase